VRYIGIDPSTKTGFVALSPSGTLLDAREMVGQGKDPKRMYSIIQAVSEAIQPGDIIAIEGFGFASQSGFLLGGIGWGIRMELYRRGFDYQEVAPAALKKFTGAGGNAGKEAVAVNVYKRWEFECPSNNVTDAYVLAQIARALHEDIELTKYQQEVIDAVRSPQKSKAKGKKIG
jgi:crossover junction endodeoxyribonuclease RuvC